MQCQAEDVAGEWAEDYTTDLYYDEIKKKELFNLILKWFDTNLDQPTFYTAGKLLETIEVTEDLCNNLSIALD